MPLITLARGCRGASRSPRVNDPGGAWVSRRAILLDRTLYSLPIKSHRFKQIVFSGLQKEQSDSKQRTSASSTYNTFPDDLYLDDQDALEGSGRGGSDSRDDLEASGSGLGPDDEDGDDDHGVTSDISLSLR